MVHSKQCCPPHRRHHTWSSMLPLQLQWGNFGGPPPFFAAIWYNVWFGRGYRKCLELFIKIFIPYRKMDFSFWVKAKVKWLTEISHMPKSHIWCTKIHLSIGPGWFKSICKWHVLGRLPQCKQIWPTWPDGLDRKTGIMESVCCKLLHTLNYPGSD